MVYINKTELTERLYELRLGCEECTDIDCVDCILANVIEDFPTADVVEAKCKNPDDENCVICNNELDEKCAGGIWDLAGEICEVLQLDNECEGQDTIYNIIRDYVERQNFCPNCGAKMDGQ